MELHWSKGTHLLTFCGLQTQPAHTAVAHRWLVVPWQFAMLGQHWLRDFCTTLQLRNADLPRLSSFLYICMYIYVCTHIYIYIFITTVPRSCDLETVGEVLLQKAYRPRIKWGRASRSNRETWGEYGSNDTIMINAMRTNHCIPAASFLPAAKNEHSWLWSTLWMSHG